MSKYSLIEKQQWTPWTATSWAGYVSGHCSSQGVYLRYTQQEDGSVPGEYWDSFGWYPAAARLIYSADVVKWVEYLFSTIKL